MLAGAMSIWFILTAISFVFVAWDIRQTPESPVLKWAFVILTAFTGPVGAFFYVLGCREPLAGTHQTYVSSTWKQVLGSTMHCAAGDGLGIIAGAAIASVLSIGEGKGLILEYALGFGFGWGYFQAYAMRSMAGGSYLRSLQMTFIPELFSMNVLMGGMQLVARPWIKQIPAANDPLDVSFWFIMSMALLTGIVCAYPMNWWLVTRHLKHGMITVAAATASARATKAEAGEPAQHHGHGNAQGAGHESSHSNHSHDQPMAKGHQASAHVGQHRGHSSSSQDSNSPSQASIVGVGVMSFAFLWISLALIAQM